RHTRSLRDWSSDVCSSDLTQGVFENGQVFHGGKPTLGLTAGPRAASLAFHRLHEHVFQALAFLDKMTQTQAPGAQPIDHGIDALDRKSVVQGRSVNLGDPT